jgi:hypothetical protein
MIRITCSLLFRSGAQALLGERWISTGGPPAELVGAVSNLAGVVLERYADEISKPGGELVVRLADRDFTCLDPPADRKAPMTAASRPTVATDNPAPRKYSKVAF